MIADHPSFHLIPGTKNMIGANLELVTADRREFRLRDALQPIRTKYTFILLDCPPALDLLTLNSLVAADGLYKRLWQIQTALEEDLRQELETPAGPDAGDALLTLSER